GAAHRRDAEENGGDGEYDTSPSQQDRLVGGPEGPDREALEPFRRGVDHHGAHGQDRRRGAAEYAGYELGDAESDGARQDPQRRANGDAPFGLRRRRGRGRWRDRSSGV